MGGASSERGRGVPLGPVAGHRHGRIGGVCRWDRSPVAVTDASARLSANVCAAGAWQGMRALTGKHLSQRRKCIMYPLI